MSVFEPNMSASYTNLGTLSEFRIRFGLDDDSSSVTSGVDASSGAMVLLKRGKQ